MQLLRVTDELVEQLREVTTTPVSPDGPSLFALELRSLELDRVNREYAKQHAELERVNALYEEMCANTGYTAPTSCKWALLYAARMVGRKLRRMAGQLTGAKA